MNDNEFKKINEKLDDCLASAQQNNLIDLDILVKNEIDEIIKYSENNKGVLAVIVTSLIKKIVSPTQDIRYHQSKMTEGYSGRTLDTQIITPFLAKNGFPAMSESGWLTRSLEQNFPYDIDYPGVITPKSLKKSFLKTIKFIQMKDKSAQIMLVYFFSELISKRNYNSSYIIAKPIDLSISKIISILNQHFTYNYTSKGAS